MFKTCEQISSFCAFMFNCFLRVAVGGGQEAPRTEAPIAPMNCALSGTIIFLNPEPALKSSMKARLWVMPEVTTRTCEGDLCSFKSGSILAKTV